MVHIQTIATFNYHSSKNSGHFLFNATNGTILVWSCTKLKITISLFKNGFTAFGSFA